MTTTLLDITKMQASINASLNAGNAFGEVGERVAANITGSVRISGTGRDLRRASAPGQAPRATPEGLLAGGVRGPHSTYVPSLHERDQRRYAAWLASSDLIGEVKARQLDRRYPTGTQLLDTRGGGPTAPFFPLVDFYVVVIFDLDGDIAMARHLTLAEMVDYVASNVGRGGGWNYKVAIGLWMTAGTDLTMQAQTGLRTLAV